MKNHKILFAVGLIALILSSCEKEYDYRIKTKLATPATLGISFAEMEDTVVLMAPKTKSYTVSVSAKAIADEMLTVTIGTNPSKVDEFNQANGTSYEIVPSDAYSFSTQTFMLPRYNTIGTTAKFTFNSSAMPDDGVAHILPLSILNIEGTDNVNMAPSDSTIFLFFRRKSGSSAGFENGSGTEDDPFIICNIGEMMSMGKVMKSGQKIWFKMDEDIDLTESEDGWIPVNRAEPYDMAVDFDGNGHKITGFYCNEDEMPSMFGVLVGSVHDVTFENAVIDVNASKAGLLGASVGTETAGAEVRNVTVNGLTINCSGATAGLGGIAGSAIGATFDNVKVNDLKMLDANEDGKMPSRIGGLVGQCEKVVSTFSNCSTGGSVLGNESVGGICGQIEAVNGVSFENCSSSCAIKSFGQKCGGLLGNGNALHLNFVGCFTTGDINSTGNYSAGLIGGFNGASTIQRCYTTGNIISNSGHYHGGIIGDCGFVAQNEGETIIEDCYSTGNLDIVSGDGRTGAGIVGTNDKGTNIFIRRCYSAGNLSAQYQNMAGIIAFAKSSDIVNDDINLNIIQCIAWNKSITAVNPKSNNWASAAIAASSNCKNTITDCYRRPDMELSDTGSSGRNYTLFDCENISPSSPMTWHNKANNYFPHHGKAAPEGSTASSVASMLGWPTEIWDLSGDYPTLK